MIQWRDEGILLSVKPFGENSVIAEVFTENQGRYAGVIRGGTSRKLAPMLQPGAQLQADWKARLSEHLGSLTVELLRSRTAQAMSGRLALAGLNAVCGLLSVVLPEREPHSDLYVQTERLLDLLPNAEVWPLAYVQWEIQVLSDLGFALDLSSCAVTGATEGLSFISPKTGRAVSTDGAGEWADRLLPLPAVLKGEGEAEAEDILQALDVTGYFIEHKVLAGLGGAKMPAARMRLIDALKRG
ncbi:DNA replication and repair protein RecO [Cognatiyoonia sediminum]|uniref:DNA repair protein RecO n=1 Tax=Cognatiyoonia sediminum TaxID=1508389 RepID=A0A1M5RKP1_9RHOB|nr:DNA replication and repair protein RecO [Cognatiyoonia sediminum]